MENRLLNELASRGCNVAASLEDTYCGSEALMVRIISKVPASTCIDRLAAASAAGDVKGAFEASHELKGLYATTSLTPLYEKCCEIVEIARAGSLDGVPERLAALRTLHDEFCALISAG